MSFGNCLQAKNLNTTSDNIHHPEPASEEKKNNNNIPTSY